MSLVDETDDLDVTRGLDVLDTSQGTRRDQASTMTLLCAPSDFLTLRVTNGRIGLGGGPQAEV